MEINQLSLGYDKIILSDINYNFEKGKLYGLLGENGAGKSTLLKALAGQLIPKKGSVRIQGAQVAHLKHRDRAALISYHPQFTPVSFPFQVKDVILMGAHHRHPIFQDIPPEELKRVEVILKEMGDIGLLERDFSTLSSGQQKIVLLARSILQDSDFILLDEPEAALDFKNKHEIFRFLKKWAVTKNKCIILSLHDPILALNYCHDLLFLKNGALLTSLELEKEELSQVEKVFRQIFGPLNIHKTQGEYYMTGFSKDPDPFGLQGLIQKTKEEMKQQGKTVLAITGDRGIGKSTFCQAFIEGKSEGVLRTFFTPEKPDELIAQYSGETLLLAKRGQGRLEKSPGAFQRLTKVLQDWTARQDLVVVDEVGFLEETETEYLETLHKLIDRGRVVLVVRQDHHPHLKEILERPQVYVLDLGKWRKGQDAG